MTVAVLLRKQVGFCLPIQAFRGHSVHLKQLWAPGTCREWGKGKEILRWMRELRL